MIEKISAPLIPTPPYVLAIGNSIGGNTSGGILFGNSANNLAQNSTSLFWDAVNSRLGIGQNVPTARVHIKGSGSTSATTSLLVTDSGGNTIFKASDNGGISSGTSTVSGSNNSAAFGVGNNVTGNSSVAFGNTNVVTGNTSIAAGLTHSITSRHCAAFGESQTLSGFNCFASGFANNISKEFSTGMGYNNTIAAPYSFALAMNSSTVLASTLAFLTGDSGKNYLYGARTHSSQSGFSSVFTGKCQLSDLLPSGYGFLTTAGNLTLTLGNGSLIIPDGNNRFWNVTIETIGLVSSITGTATGVSIGDSYRETKQLLFKKVAGVSSIVGTVDTTAIKSDASMSTSLLTITAGASQQMALTFTAPTFVGGGSINCVVTSKVTLVEAAF
jgi:hypothetical protein